MKPGLLLFIVYLLSACEDDSDPGKGGGGQGTGAAAGSGAAAGDDSIHAGTGGADGGSSGSATGGSTTGGSTTGGASTTGGSAAGDVGTGGTSGAAGGSDAGGGGADGGGGAPADKTCGTEGLECLGTELCLELTVIVGPGQETDWACVENPCGAAPIACDCAQEACEDELPGSSCQQSSAGQADLRCSGSG